MSIAPADMDRLVAAAEAAADVAGAVVRPFFRVGLGADLKADRSPVTIADRSAEQAMRAVLTERFPDHGVLGEEFGLDRPQARLRWVLDPIDGTRAFITGRPTFGTLVALLDGETTDRRRDRPAGDTRALGRRGRSPHAVQRAAGWARRLPTVRGTGRGRTVLHQPRDDGGRRAAALAPAGGGGAAQLLGRRLLRLRSCWRSARSTWWPNAT